MSFSLRYQEHLPPRDLAPWVACIWQLVGEVVAGGSVQQRILPDGCADLVFDIDHARRGGTAPDSVVGPMTRATVVELRDGIEIVGIRFRPGVIGTSSGIPAGRLVDVSLSLQDLAHASRICSSEQLAACPPADRFALLANACRATLGRLDGPDPVVDLALARWSKTAATFPTVSVLVRDIGLSERAFERRFVARVGLTPVQYRRLARFRAVLRLYSQGVKNWATLAATAGYSDQSHLVRDFGSFAGLTPTAWAATQGNAGFLQDGAIATL